MEYGNHFELYKQVKVDTTLQQFSIDAYPKRISQTSLPNNIFYKYFKQNYNILFGIEL
jgi:hypothetical protein